MRLPWAPVKAPLVAEQLGFEQCFRYGGTVEGDERLAGARAEIVQATGHTLLAATGFAAYQHVDRQAGQVQHLPAQLLQALGHAEQRAFELRLQVGLLM